MFNLTRWLDKKTGSSLMGQMSYLSATGFEKVDANTVVLHLDTPTITVPYDLYAFPALIVPSTFSGDVTQRPAAPAPLP